METILPSASPVPVPVASPSPFHLVPSNAVDLEPHPDNVPYGISWTVMRNLGFDVGYALGVASTVEDYSGMASEMVGIVSSLARRGLICEAPRD
jgi:hypothetical protein